MMMIGILIVVVILLGGIGGWYLGEYIDRVRDLEQRIEKHERSHDAVCKKICQLNDALDALKLEANKGGGL